MCGQEEQGVGFPVWLSIATFLQKYFELPGRMC